MRRKAEGNTLIALITALYGLTIVWSLDCQAATATISPETQVFTPSCTCTFSIVLEDGESLVSDEPVVAGDGVTKLGDNGLKFSKAAIATVTWQVQKTDPNDPTSEITQEVTVAAKAVELYSAQITDPVTGRGAIALADGAATLPMEWKKDCAVNLLAAPNPPEVNWPSGKPVWAGAHPASGVESFDFTVPAPGEYVFTAECGKSATVILRALKVKFLPHSKKVGPDELDKYDVKQHLTEDSFDKDKLKWTVENPGSEYVSVDGDGIVSVIKNPFGHIEKIEVTATSTELDTVKDTFTLKLEPLKVTIVKICQVSNPIDPNNPRYLGLSKWKKTPETRADPYACGDKGAEIEVKCEPEELNENLPLELTLNIKGRERRLFKGKLPGGKHKIKLKHKIAGPIGKYKLKAVWGDARDERDDWWFLRKWGSHIKIDGWEADSDAFLKKYEMYVKIASLLKKIDMIPSAFTKWEPEKWNLRISWDKGLAQNVWCDHDCPEHDHERGSSKRLCEYAYSSVDNRGSTRIRYTKNYDAAEGLAGVMVNATPLGRIPSVLGIGIAGKVAELLAKSLKKSSGIDAQGRIRYGGSASVRRHANQYYYPCYVFEPFLGDNKANKWFTGRVVIRPKVSARANLSLRKFWRKKFDGKTYVEWYVDAFHAANQNAYIPISFKTVILLNPAGEWRGYGIYNRTAVDRNGRRFRLLNNTRKNTIRGRIGAILHQKWRLIPWEAGKKSKTLNYYSYAYITKDGGFVGDPWVQMDDDEASPKIPNINYPITEEVIPYAKAH